MKEDKEQKYIRTQMKLDSGEIVCARICVATGEIKPHKYPIGKPLPKVVAKEGVESVPPWTVIPPPSRDASIREGKEIRVSKDNPNNIYLKDFMFYSDAVEAHPILEDIFIGATSLGDGASNPLSKNLLFSMLRDLDVINVDTVQEYCNKSTKHCWRMAQCLRIISNALDMEVNR